MALAGCIAKGDSGDMERGQERRSSPRTRAGGLVCLSLDGSIEKAVLTDHSNGGMGIRTRAALSLGDILYCASPALAVCTRARVVHVRRGFVQRTVGLEYLASLADFA